MFPVHSGSITPFHWKALLWEWLAVKGYDKKFGARPLARVIQEHIKKPLSEELLFGALTAGGSVVMRMSGTWVSPPAPGGSCVPGRPEP